MAVAHEVQAEREQGFGAGHAGQSLGEGKALVLRPAGVVARRQDVERAVLDRGEAGVAVILKIRRASWRERACQYVSAADVADALKKTNIKNLPKHEHTDREIKK